MHLRGKDKIARRLLIHAAAFHLSLLQPLGLAAARQAAELLRSLCFCAACTPQPAGPWWLNLAGSPPGWPTRRGTAIPRRTVKTFCPPAARVPGEALVCLCYTS